MRDRSRTISSSLSLPPASMSRSYTPACNCHVRKEWFVFLVKDLYL